MKNIEQILQDAGIELTDEQKTKVNEAVSQNYKTITDYQKQRTKLEAAEAARDAANETLDKFKDIDPDKINEEIQKYKDEADAARKNAEREILKRDQADHLKAKFDALGITSERIRKSLIADITSDEGLKWKDNKFLGLDDYLKDLNEKEHLYKTEEEKAKEEQEAGARQRVPKFTDPSENRGNQSGGSKGVPVIW